MERTIKNLSTINKFIMAKILEAKSDKFEYKKRIKEKTKKIKSLKEQKIDASEEILACEEEIKKYSAKIEACEKRVAELQTLTPEQAGAAMNEWLNIQQQRGCLGPVSSDEEVVDVYLEDVIKGNKRHLSNAISYLITESINQCSGRSIPVPNGKIDKFIMLSDEQLESLIKDLAENEKIKEMLDSKLNKHGRDISLFEDCYADNLNLIGGTELTFGLFFAIMDLWIRYRSANLIGIQHNPLLLVIGSVLAGAGVITMLMRRISKRLDREVSKHGEKINELLSNCVEEFLDGV